MTTARFWHVTPAGNLVRIKLRAGQELHHSIGGPDDEGWWSESHRFAFDGLAVTDEQVTDGRDCDGRLTRVSSWRCPLPDLASRHNEGADGLLFPDWQEIESSQRDEYAEAAGY